MTRAARLRASLLRAGLVALLWLVLAGGASSTNAGDETLVVGPGGAFTSLQEALEAAHPGQRIEVRGGRYPGPLHIVRPVILEGVGAPEIAGDGRGSVVHIQAPGVILRGFSIRGSGSDLASEDAGVVAQDAAGVVLAGNRLDDVLFGIYLKNAPGARVEGNTIRGKPLPPARRGDGIRLWYSAGARVEGNHVTSSRDVILWFSPESVVRSNQISEGRYGIHLMYNDRTRIEGNVLEGNSVGAFLMYSTAVDVRENLFVQNRGPSGYGLGAKDVDDLTSLGNLFVGNRVGLYLDNTPRLGSPSQNLIRENLFAYNDVGLSAQPSVRNNVIQINTFLDNLQQVSARGGGTLEGNLWSREGRGNFWSDYAGYDAGGDGVGDIPYRPASLFENLMDRMPELRLFLFSPAQQAVELASRAFPILPSRPKLVDEAPLMEPTHLGSVLLERSGRSASPPHRVAWWTASSLAAAALLLAWTTGGDRRRPARGAAASASEERTTHPAVMAPEAAPLVHVERLVKSYGRKRVLDGVDLRVFPGEAVALWGENGAGKTTLIKCLLGLVSYSGTVLVAGWDPHEAGVTARAHLGYVPQEVRLEEDWTAWETLAFVARLRRFPEERAARELERAGLTPQAGHRVGTLSGGMRQRLALAAALLADPPLLLLDEPSANLDAGARALVHERLRELRAQGKALLFTTHRADEAMALADRVLVLEGGRIASDTRSDRWLASSSRREHGPQRPLDPTWLHEAGGPAAPQPRGEES